MIGRFLIPRVPILLIAVLLYSCASRPTPNHTTSPSTTSAKLTKPTLILWAWDRAEDLRFLKPGEAEIAALMATMQLHNGRVDMRRRRLPLLANPAILIKAVVRLESDGSPLPPIDRMTERLEVAANANFDGIQLDFDARQSQLDWYGSLIYSLHQRSTIFHSPTGQPLTHVSITALASWCVGKPWFTGDRDVLRNSFDEVVPMLFRMGNDRAATLNQIAAHQDFAPECRGALGVALDEPLPWRPPANRIYIFNSSRWTREAFDQACARFL